jgi:DNA-directed RNA polymerase specialized sigma24 family protein
MTPALVTTIKACFAVAGRPSNHRVRAIFVAVGKELAHQEADQENCSQHLYTLIEQLRASYDPMKGDPKTFTYTFARNKCLHFLEKPSETSLGTEAIKRKHRSTEELKSVDKALKFPVAPSATLDPVDSRAPSDPVVSAEERDLLAKALCHLDNDARAIIVRRASSDLTWEALAAESKTPCGTLKSRWNEAWRVLIVIIENGGTPPPKSSRTRKRRQSRTEGQP